MTAIGSHLDEVGGAIAAASWFAAVGEPWTAADRSDAESYIHALRLGVLHVAIARDWHDAARITQDMGWSTAWWDAEERQRHALTAAAERRFDRHAVMTALSTVMATAGEMVHGRAALATTHAGIADPALTRVAAGAATMASHQFALATIAQAPQTHPFHIKFRLFASGRWPLCVVGDSLYVF